MKTIDQFEQLAAAPSAPELATLGVRRNSERAVEVVAVVVERDDGTSRLYCRGSGGDWPSAEEARYVVERVSTDVVWHETTPAVWVGRSGESNGPTPDRGGGRTRRLDPPRRPSTSPDRETYLAALVLRGMVGSGHSRGRGNQPDAEEVSQVG